MNRVNTRLPIGATIFLAVFLSFSIASCGSSDSSDSDETSNRARFTFDCDVEGLNAVLDIEIEAVASSGIVWGGGPNPQITAVIGTGDVIYFTAGTLQSPTASYIFTGENQFADFTDVGTAERFRVQWVVNSGGLTMIVNPFGPGPVSYICMETSADYL